MAYPYPYPYPPPPPQGQGRHRGHAGQGQYGGQYGQTPPPFPQMGPYGPYGQYGFDPYGFPIPDPNKNNPPPTPDPAAPPNPEPTPEPPKPEEDENVNAPGVSTAGGFSRQAQHSKEIILAFRPIKIFLTILGQMPFVVRPKKDGTYAFKFYKCSLAVFVYMCMFILSTFLYLTVTLGIVSFIAGDIFHYIQPTHKVVVEDKDDGSRSMILWERYLVRHEMVSMIVVWSWQTVAFAGSLYIVTNSKYYVHYMNYFNRVVQIMDMDMTPGVSGYLFVNNMLSFIVASLLVGGFVFGSLTDFDAVSDTSAVIANFIFRLFNIELETYGEYHLWFEVLGFVIMVYSLFGSRANVVQFLFFSQLLKNGSRVWNERLRKVLTHEEVTKEQTTDQLCRRLEPRLVYKDHLMIVQLYQMTENVFGTILFAYYSLTLISIVMELYQLAALQGIGTNTADTDFVEQDENIKKLEKLEIERMGISDETDVTQEHEILAVAGVALLLLGQNIFFCYRTTVDAAKAYEYAMKGFDILRRHGLMYCKNKTDRNFVLSLYLSFAKNNPLQLTAGGYFAVNKILLVTMLSTIVNWAISIYQTKIDQWK